MASRMTAPTARPLPAARELGQFAQVNVRLVQRLRAGRSVASGGKDTREHVAPDDGLAVLLERLVAHGERNTAQCCRTKGRCTVGGDEEGVLKGLEQPPVMEQLALGDRTSVSDVSSSAKLRWAKEMWQRWRPRRAASASTVSVLPVSIRP